MKKVLVAFVMVLLFTAPAVWSSPIDKDVRDIVTMLDVLGKSRDQVHDYFEASPDEADDNMEFYEIEFHKATYGVCIEYVDGKSWHVSLFFVSSNKDFLKNTDGEYKRLETLTACLFGKSETDATVGKHWKFIDDGVLIVLNRSTKFSDTENALGLDMYCRTNPSK